MTAVVSLSRSSAWMIERARLGLGGRGRVDEEVVAVARHGEPPRLELAREIGGLAAQPEAEALEEPAGVLVLDLDADAVVVLGTLSVDLACLGERRRRTPARDAQLVEVLRDAAEEERVAGAEDQAGVDVGRGADDALVEQVADLVGRRLEHVLADLVDRPARLAA